MSISATPVFLCSECTGTTSFPLEITLGENTVDFTCAHCGERWHVLFEVTSLEPLHIGTLLVKRSLGVIRDGRFFAKAKMQ